MGLVSVHERTNRGDTLNAGKNPEIVEFYEANYLTIESIGEPAGKMFVSKVEALYPLAKPARGTSIIRMMTSIENQRLPAPLNVAPEFGIKVRTVGDCPAVNMHKIKKGGKKKSKRL